MAETRSTARIHPHHRGQALAEFALILPILLAIVGAGIDFARAFEVSMTLQTATRNAAEAAAFSSTSEAQAEAKARAVVCAEAQRLPGFVTGSGGDVATCTSPTVSAIYTKSETAPGANSKYPLVTVTVTTSLDFRMTVPWPMLPNGTWTLGNTESFAIMQGR